MTRSIPIFLLAIGLVSPSAAGQPNTPKVGEIPVSSRTILGVTLGVANLADVTSRVGRADIWGDGDGGNAEAKVCYAATGPGALVLVFASNSEMAGPNQELTDIRILKSTGYADTSKCSPLDVKAQRVRAPSGLTVGISLAEVRAILGQPTQKDSHQWEYDWSLDKPLAKTARLFSYWSARRQECFEDKDPYYTVTSIVTVASHGGHVSAITFSRIESIC